MTELPRVAEEARGPRVNFLIGAAIVVMLAGLAIPGWRTWRLAREESRAVDDLNRIADAIGRFWRDTGVPPTRDRQGRERALLRLNGPGLIPQSAYYRPDSCQGRLVDHLVRNQPQGAEQPGYSGWRGPYLEELGTDPWGGSYVVVAWPLNGTSEHVALVVSAGRDGAMDADYSAPTAATAAGDDLVVAIPRPADR